MIDSLTSSFNIITAATLSFLYLYGYFPRLSLSSRQSEEEWRRGSDRETSWKGSKDLLPPPTPNIFAICINCEMRAEITAFSFKHRTNPTLTNQKLQPLSRRSPPRIPGTGVCACLSQHMSFRNRGVAMVTGFRMA